MENLNPSYAGEGIYRENIIDHFKSPRNFGVIKDANINYKELNPVCGDEVCIFLKLNKDKIADFKYNAKGCAICVAATSMLSEQIKGKGLAEIKSLDRKDVLSLLNIPIGPVRIKCAMLSLIAIKAGILNYENNGVKNELGD